MNQDSQTHTIWQTIALHLLPGLLITAFYFLTAPLVMKASYPSQMALLVAILFVLIPFELGYLLYQGQKRNGRLSLMGVVLNREPMPLWQYFIFVPILLGWSFAAFTFLSPLDTYLTQKLFAWFPAWSIPSTLLTQIAQYSPTALLVTFLLALALNGLAGPLVEELYFRGYLLPRIPAAKLWAPLFNVVLFSLYHFFSPWQNITRIVALIPLIYVVSRKHNIYISILVHCLLNTLGALSALALLPR
jgi:membrane protease YdiL (CAAX protease family)